MRLNALVDVPITVVESGSRFHVLENLSENFVFNAGNGSGGRPATTTGDQ